MHFDPFKISTAEHDADIVFITHAHYDHLDPKSVEKISGRNTVFVAPSSMAQEMRKVTGNAELVLMAPGDIKNISDITIQAIPAYNRLKPFHPKRNGWLGYIVTMDGVSYYVAGDTDAVSIMGLMNDKGHDVQLLIDEDVLKEEKIIAKR